MLGKFGEFIFSGWGSLSAFVVGFAVLVGAWKLDRYVYGVKQFNAGTAKERAGNRRKANANVDKANRARDRARSADTRRLQPSPYVRRQGHRHVDALVLANSGRPARYLCDAKGDRRAQQRLRHAEGRQGGRLLRAVRVCGSVQGAQEGAGEDATEEEDGGRHVVSDDQIQKRIGGLEQRQARTEERIEHIESAVNETKEGVRMLLDRDARRPEPANWRTVLLTLASVIALMGSIGGMV